MKAWLTSFNDAITLSLVALFSLLVRSYFDTRYILVENFGFLGPGFTLGWIFGYSAIIGGWMWALVAAARGSQRAWITLFAYALITGLGFGAASLLAFANFAVEFFLLGTNLVAGVFAAIAVALHLRKSVT